MRASNAGRDRIVILVVPAWMWKEFIAFELLGGAAFYLIGKLIMGAEWFSVAANVAGPQMLRYTATAFRM